MPLEDASSPSGTATSIVYDAVSVGWSFTGNHVAATCGCPATRAPSSVGMKPDRPRFSTIGAGTPSYRTTTRNRERSRRPRCGVTVSSSPSRDQAAVRPSTTTDRTARPDRSRLNADRSWVACAVIVASPTITSVAGS